MELTTKFNINHEVWFLHPNSQKAVQGRIKEIQLKVGGGVSIFTQQTEQET